jgi:hypothetical protein
MHASKPVSRSDPDNGPLINSPTGQDLWIGVSEAAVDHAVVDHVRRERVRLRLLEGEEAI